MLGQLPYAIQPCHAVSAATAIRTTPTVLPSMAVARGLATMTSRLRPAASARLP